MGRGRPPQDGPIGVIGSADSSASRAARRDQATELFTLEEREREFHFSPIRSGKKLLTQPRPLGADGEFIWIWLLSTAIGLK